MARRNPPSLKLRRGEEEMIDMEQKIENFKIASEKFSGPLDLLVSLIESKKMDITEISLAKVTDDFLKFLGDLKLVHPKMLADFLIIASKLILIKSRMLLPTIEISKEEEEDIDELSKRLKIYQEFRLANNNIKNLYFKNPLFSRQFLLGKSSVFLPPKDISLLDLKKSFDKVWKEFSEISIEEEKVEKESKMIKIEDKIREIFNNLKERIEFSFSQLTDKKSKKEIIVSFLAILHLFKDQYIEIEQSDVFDEIRLRSIIKK